MINELQDENEELRHLKEYKHKSLNYGELNNLASLDVRVSDYIDDNWGEILDSEDNLVCLVPIEQAELMVRLLNTYQHVPDHEKV